MPVAKFSLLNHDLLPCTHLLCLSLFRYLWEAWACLVMNRLTKLLAQILSCDIGGHMEWFFRNHYPNPNIGHHPNPKPDPNVTSYPKSFAVASDLTYWRHALYHWGDSEARRLQWLLPQWMDLMWIWSNFFELNLNWIIKWLYRGPIDTLMWI